MNRSETIGELAKALSAAQGEMSGAKKDANNPHFKKPYASLESVIDAYREPFSKHGLAVSQWPSHQGDAVKVETILMHESGEWLSDSITAPFDAGTGRSSVQAVGSAITYLRRYSLMALVGIAPEDDDAEATGGRGKKEAPDERAARQAQHDSGWESDRAGFCAALGLLGLTLDQLNTWLESKGIRRASHLTSPERRKLIADVKAGKAGPQVKS